MPENCTQRVTIRFTPSVVDELDRLVDHGVYPNRSEAVRHAVLEIVDRERLEAQELNPNAAATRADGGTE